MKGSLNESQTFRNRAMQLSQFGKYTWQRQQIAERGVSSYRLTSDVLAMRWTDTVIAGPVLWAIIMMFTLTRCLVIDGRRRGYRREYTKENITSQNTLSRFVLRIQC